MHNHKPKATLNNEFLEEMTTFLQGQPEPHTSELSQRQALELADDPDVQWQEAKEWIV